MRGSETTDLEDLMLAKDFIAIYFGAHWCPPARGFTNILREVYETVNADDKLFGTYCCLN